MALTSGTRLGPYEIQSPLGAGGMGEVYRARDTRLGRDVAIKVLPEALVQDADRLRRFEQEARTIASLNHPNILAIHDIGTHDGAPFLVSEFLEGMTLREKLEAGPLPARRAIEYALGFAQGLAAAHEKGIVHRDLKPENVFITRDGRVKVLDFGLAKLVRPEERTETALTLGSGTLPGMVLGTVGYMSPEHFQFWRGPLRNADRETRLQTGHIRRNHDRGFARGTSGTQRIGMARPAGSAAHPDPLPGKAHGAALPVGQRSGFCD
jgi:serine/threonine protein kinase